LTFARDGTRLAAARADGTVLLWDVRDPRRATPARAPLRNGESPLTRVTFSPDSRLLATVDQVGAARIWEVADASEPHLSATLPGKGQFLDVAFSPDGSCLATTNSDGSAHLWDLRTGRWRPLSLEHPSAVLKVAFSPDGKRLATVDQERSIRLWDVKQGNLLLDPFQGHASGLVTAIAFHPGGSQLATAGSDRTVKVWDSELGLELFTLRGHSSGVSDLAFSPDGKLLATAGGKVRLEPLAVEDLVTLAQQRLDGRKLSRKERRIYLRH
jgi:WD40 repeat protein